MTRYGIDTGFAWDGAAKSMVQKFFVRGYPAHGTTCSESPLFSTRDEAEAEKARVSQGGELNGWHTAAGW